MASTNSGDLEAPEALRLAATGTDDTTADGDSAHSAEDAKGGISGATACEEESDQKAQIKSPKPLRVADLGDRVRRDAKGSGGGTRTIAVFSGKNALFQKKWHEMRHGRCTTGFCAF